MAAKPRSVVIIGILALTIAAVAAYSLYTYLMGQQAQVKSAVATSKIVVAAQDIGAGTAINSAQVKTVNWPQSALPQGASSSADQVVARVTIDRFTAGEPIVESKLVPKEGQPGILTYKIPEGHRAMTVGVDPVSGVAGFVMPGNRIDVVLTVSPSGQQQPVSKIVLQDVPVLAIGQTVEQQKEGKALETKETKLPPAKYDAKIEASRIATTEEVLKIARGDLKGPQLVDSRTPAEYEGQDVRAKRGGHIPRCSVNISHVDIFDKTTGKLRSMDELEKIYGVLDKKKRVIPYCQTGTRSTLAYVAFRAMGFRDPANYDDSWIIWGNDEKNCPVER